MLFQAFPGSFNKKSAKRRNFTPLPGETVNLIYLLFHLVPFSIAI